VEDARSNVHGSPALERYRKRFERSGGKIFTFLDHDGVPWNNNNAEHAIKPFARYRRFADGRFTERSVKDFLVLLSVFQTCAYRNINVLDFLLSRATVIPRDVRCVRRRSSPVNGRLVDCRGEH
jgi:hypothetical protein